MGIKTLHRTLRMGHNELLYPPNSGSEDTMDLASSRRRVRRVRRVRRRDFLVNALQVRVLVRSFLQSWYESVLRKEDEAY